MAKYNFNLRDAQLDANTKKPIKRSLQTETPINFVIRWNNLKLVYPTNLTILPDDWINDKKKGNNYQRAKTSLIGHAEFNATLGGLESTARETFNRLLNEYKRQPTVNELREKLDIALNRQQFERMDFFKYFDKFISESKFKTNLHTNKPFSNSTIGIYKTALQHIKDFAPKYPKKIDFDTIDLDFYYKFMEYLTDTKKFSENNKGKIIKVLKTVLNDAMERGVTKNRAFKSKLFRVVSEEVENIYLNELELKEIYNLDLSSNSRLDKVRDLFYIGCTTGLRFSDLSKVKKENIDGNRLRINSKKTNTRLTIHLTPEALAIINKYNGVFPPSISNQKMNDYIKEVCELIPLLKNKVEITKIEDGLKVIRNIEKYKLVQTHTARRSFATNSYYLKIPVNTIMAITGHKKESSFLRYLKLDKDDHADVFEMYLNRNKETNLKLA